MVAHDAWLEAGKPYPGDQPGMSAFIIITIIDLNVSKGGKGFTGYPSIYGCPRAYTGWMYTSLHAVVSMYDSRCTSSLIEFDRDDTYVLPRRGDTHMSQVIRMVGNTYLICTMCLPFLSSLGRLLWPNAFLRMGPIFIGQAVVWDTV